MPFRTRAPACGTPLSVSIIIAVIVLSHRGQFVGHEQLQQMILPVVVR